MKKFLSYTLTAGIAFGLGIFAIAMVLRPQPLEIGTIGLSAVADGHYIGICQNKILFAVVDVEVKDHVITNIDVLEHKASYMGPAVQVASNVCVKQSLDVDAISGATLTRSTILKAIENALTDALD